MARQAFQPVGAEARWKPVYRRLADLGIGDLVTYTELSALAGIDIHGDRTPYYRAVEELQRENKRTLENVRGEGYRIVDAPEHERLAIGHQRRSYRQIRKARTKVASADHDRLSADEIKRFDAYELRMRQVESLVRGLHKRVGKVEAQVEATDKRQTNLEQDMQAVRDILSRHGLLEKAAA